ncbi:hypothetical protein [Caldovatus aquaticus]|uniref:Glycosyltransferase RgtA/B/C/D-like domain-containing protein n=1 Tax=Caldovatus aquaticus TaxID=2865671 RepID=A0ABS7F566_9PROT|nr:hypothetical protein [Caldovatus aquaticus]MBW8269931.1 hypothetical protein [Caldovatus aquaticus]
MTPPQRPPGLEPQAAALAARDEGAAVAAGLGLAGADAGALEGRHLAAAARARMLRWAAFAPAVLYLLVILAPPLNHDVAAVLDFAERWLAGERLYRDLIDVNPPLIFVLNLVPAALAAWTPLDGVQALLLSALGLCALCWRLTLALLRGAAGAARPGPVEAAVLEAMVPLLCVVAGYDFGQREHLMAVVALPYCALAARRIEGHSPPPARLAAGVAVLAALGFALKPHFLAVPALVEAVVLLRRGPARALRDPVPWLMAAVWLAYLAAIPLLFPDYFGHVVPLVWAYYLDLAQFGTWEVLFSPILGPAALALALVLPLALRRGAGPLAQALAAAACGALASAVVQHKGWTYHAVPVTMLTAGAAAAALARWLDRVLPAGVAARPGVAQAAAAIAALGLGLYAARGGEAPWRELWFHGDRAGRIAAFVKREAYGERLLVLSPDIYPVYPALNYAHARSTLRTMNLWLLQGVYRTCPENGARYRETWEMSRAEFFVYRTVAEDFARTLPAAVLVSRNPGIPWCGREFDFVEYFARHPLFAETWQRYRPAGEIEGYRLYVREE